jgi:hypothetical protein
MGSISSLTSATLYAASAYQNPAQKPALPGAPASTPGAPPAQDSITLSPAGLAALKNSTNDSPDQQPTHAQLVQEAASGNPTAKAILAAEKKAEGLSSCS